MPPVSRAPSNMGTLCRARLGETDSGRAASSLSPPGKVPRSLVGSRAGRPLRMPHHLEQITRQIEHETLVPAARYGDANAAARCAGIALARRPATGAGRQRRWRTVERRRGFDCPWLKYHPPAWRRIWAAPSFRDTWLVKAGRAGIGYLAPAMTVVGTIHSRCLGMATSALLAMSTGSGGVGGFPCR